MEKIFEALCQIGVVPVIAIDRADDAVPLARALLAGAQYIVSPGFDAAVVDWCQEHHVPVLPGVATPTEINMALVRGLKILKFFPAEEFGGVRMLKALHGPYPEVRFIPTGGIRAHNLAEYLALPNVAACGGSWMATSRMIAGGSVRRDSTPVNRGACDCAPGTRGTRNRPITSVALRANHGAIEVATMYAVPAACAMCMDYLLPGYSRRDTGRLCVGTVRGLVV